MKAESPMLRTPSNNERLAATRRLVRRIVWIVLGAAAVVGIVFAMRPRALPVDMAKIERGGLIVTVDEEGKTRVRERYMVSAPLSGRMLRIDLDPGDEVKAGETLLATIEPSDPSLLDPRAQAEAEARVKAAEIAVKASEPTVERARAALDFARSEFTRAKQLYEAKTLPEIEFDTAQMLQRTRVEELRSAELGQQIAAFELEQAQAALLRTKADGNDDKASHFEIRSPINGRVLRVLHESAGIVNPGDDLIELGDPTDLEIEVDVLSSDAVKMHLGADMILEHWGGPVPLAAKIKRIEPSAFTKISALGVEEQRVYVVGELVDPVEKWRSLGDGFRVEARIVIWEGKGVLKAPTSALFRQGDKWAVFVVEQGVAHLRIVEIGNRNNLEAEVLKGLNEGDTVVMHPSDAIEDGVSVQPRSN